MIPSENQYRTSIMNLKSRRKFSSKILWPQFIGHGLLCIYFNLTTLALADENQSSSGRYFSGQAAEFCAPKKFKNKFGVEVTGTKDCSTAADANCTSDGQVGCKATTSFKALNVKQVVASKIKSGTTIAGVSGTLQDCTTYGLTDCVSTSTYPSGQIPNPWDLRQGVTLSGVSGKLQTACRNGVSLGSFDQGEIPKSATIDNTTDIVTITSHGWSNNQTVQGYWNTAPTGLTAGTVYYVINATANTFQLSLTNNGSAIDMTTNGVSVYFYKSGGGLSDYWDNVDDYLGSATNIPSYTAWNAASHVCGGIEAATDDSNIWKDVTTTGDGVTASSCTASAANCSYKDKITTQEWHKADTTGRNWSDALTFCDALTYNGKFDWRLPTEKELNTAYSHGLISTAGATNWITLSNFAQQYWTATSSKQNIGSYAMDIFIAAGRTYDHLKFNTFRVICTRP
jgi:hypothetical protein